MTTPVYAPDITTYATRTPYLTAQEFIDAGTGCDVSQLVPGDSNQVDQTAALVRVISRASAWADSLTYKVLAATQDTQAGYFRLQYDGSLAVPVVYTPLIAVTAISIGSDPWSLSTVSDFSRVGIDGRVVIIGSGCTYPGNVQGRRFVKVSYVNGWACTTLAASASIGATSITVASPLGLYPGITLTIADGGSTEQVTVGAGYTSGTTVPLAAPTAFFHAAQVSISAMPQDVKQAVISLTSCLIKTRGSQAVVMASMSGEPAKTELSESGGIEDFEIASDLLEPFRRVW